MIRLKPEEIKQYQEEGLLVIKSFYDQETEIFPIQQDIYKLLGLLIKQHRLSIQQEPLSPTTFDSGLPELLRSHRQLVGVLYDALKKIPSYVALANAPKNIELAKILLGSDFVGFANRGYGIRMDNPSEDKFLTQWHQDYTSQLCAPAGAVFWSPLRDVTEAVGPVAFCPGSQREGILPIIRRGEGSHGLVLKNEEQIVAKYSIVKPELKAGDIVVADFLTLHCSTPNRSQHTRWAMISRYFNFLDATGVSYGWKGGLQEGNSFERVHPELSEVEK